MKVLKAENPENNFRKIPKNPKNLPRRGGGAGFARQGGFWLFSMTGMGFLADSPPIGHACLLDIFLSLQNVSYYYFDKEM